MTITCPVDLSSVSTCRFYCNGLHGCPHITVDVKSTKAVINGNGECGDFKVVANGSQVESTNSVVNISCTAPGGCSNISVIVGSYYWVNVNCSNNRSCECGYFELDNIFHEVNITSISAAMSFANISVSNTPSLVVCTLEEDESEDDEIYEVVEDEFGYGYNNSIWNLNNIQAVEIYCYDAGQCRNVSININKVAEFAMECGTEVEPAGYSCQFARITAIDSNVYLMCQGDGNSSCADMKLVCPAQSTGYGCQIDCMSSSLGTSNCMDMTVTVPNSAQGYDDISLNCETSDACQNVSVVCDDASAMSCSCPVSYDPEKGWYCDGPCGSTSCTGTTKAAGDNGDSSSDSISTTMIIGVAVGATAAVFLVIIGCCVYRRRKKRSNPNEISEPLRLKPSKGDYQHL